MKKKKTRHPKTISKTHWLHINYVHCLREKKRNAQEIHRTQTHNRLDVPKTVPCLEQCNQIHTKAEYEKKECGKMYQVCRKLPSVQKEKKINDDNN